MITSDAITWNAPNDDHPARAASQRSYSAVAKGDLAEWLTVYAEDAVLGDPVGPSMFDPEGTGHRGRAACEGEAANGAVQLELGRVGLGVRRDVAGHRGDEEPGACQGRSAPASVPVRRSHGHSEPPSRVRGSLAPCEECH